MRGTLERCMREGQYIYDRAPQYGMRTGQLLFNSLRYEIAEKVRNTKLDTFYKEMTLEELVEWLRNHIIYDNQGRMVRLFSKHKILWEETQDAA